MRRLAPLIAVLLVQAVLLFWNLDLLSLWDDEVSSLALVQGSVAEMFRSLRGNVHPPLYFLLLKAWPWHTDAGLRAVSGLWALVATCGLFALSKRRWLPVAFFALSPCVLLYGRMARSYTMQAALALFAVGFLWRWMSRPAEVWRAAVPAAGLCVLLLYTHYISGLAILGAFVLVGARQVGGRAAAMFVVAVAAGYLPWLLTLGEALRHWGHPTAFASQYALTGSVWAEQLLKVGFGVVSLSIGETFPAASLLLVPLIAWWVWRGLSEWDCRVALVVAAAVIGYVGVARWVSYPFIPARLLWVMPFASLALARGLPSARGWRAAAVAVMLLSAALSAHFYFRKEHFLNLGYAVPLREIAARIDSETSASDVILLDGYNTDHTALIHYLAPRAQAIVLMEENLPRASQAVASAGPSGLCATRATVRPDTRQRWSSAAPVPAEWRVSGPCSPLRRGRR